LSIKRFTRQQIAGFCAALLISAPMARAFLDADVVLYFAVTIAFFVAAVLSPSAWKFHPFQVVWMVLLVGLFTTLFAASFPFTYDFKQFIIAAGFLAATIIVGLLSSLGWDKKFFFGFFYLTVLVSSLIAILVFYGYIAGNSDFRKLWDVGYLSSGTTIATGFCLSLPFFLYSQGKYKFLWGIIALVLFLGVVAGLSRGALLFSAIIALVLLCFYWPKQGGRQSTKLKTRLFIICGGAVGMFLFLPGRTLGRLERLFFGQELVAGRRGSLWSNAFEFITEAPIIGHGLGHGGGAVMYPHNLFLQVGMDGGIIAMLSLSLVIAFPILVFMVSKYNKAIQYQPLAWGFLAVYLMLILEYSKSGDFYKARSLFIFGAVLTAYAGMEARKMRKTFLMNSDRCKKV
jgi:O-antigen ligase